MPDSDHDTSRGVGHGRFRAFIGFGAPVRGRERQAIKVFNEGFEITPGCSKRVRSTVSSRFSSAARRGAWRLFPVRGDQDKLARIRSSEEFERLTAPAHSSSRPRIAAAALGGRLMSQMSVFGSRWKNLPSSPESLIHADHISAGDVAQVVQFVAADLTARSPGISCSRRDSLDMH